MQDSQTRSLIAVNWSLLKRFAAFGTLDVLIVVGAYLCTMIVRLMELPLEPNSRLWMVMLAALIMPPSLYVFGVYHRIWQHTSGHEAISIAKGVLLAVCITMAINLVQSPRPLPISVVLVSSALALSGMVVLRYWSRVPTGISWRWRAIWRNEFPERKTRVLIVGTGDSAQLLALRLRRSPPQSHPYQIVGFIDDDSDKHNLLVEGVRVMGTRHDIGRLVQEFKIDVIAIALGQMSAAEFREVLKYCEHTSARIKVIPDVLDLMQTQHSKPTLLRDVELEDLIGRGQVSQHEAVNLEALRHKVVLVTGAAGSIGSELSRQIIRYEPTCLLLLDNNESGLYDLEMELRARAPLLKLIPVLADITQRDQLEAVFKQHQPQLVFHAAAYKHVPMLEEYPAQALAVNIGGTLHLALLAAEYKAERFILISTDKAIRPSSVMGASKRVCEELLHALADETDLHTRYASVRFGNVLGSRGSVVPLFTRQIEQGGPVTVTHPDMTRYFLTIPEAVNLVIHAACLTDGGDTFLLKMGERVRILDLAERMIRLRGLRPGVDMAIKITGIRPGEKLHEELFDSEEQVTETVHPHIVKVTSRCHDWDAQSLLDELRQLLHDSPKTAAAALDALLKILAHQPDVSYNRHVLQPADKPK